MSQNLFRHKILIHTASFIMSVSFLTALFVSGINMHPSAANNIENKVKMDVTATQTDEKETDWTGIDVSIVGKYAEKYGRPPRDPYINTDKGDLLLFVFTVAGVVGGFIIGFNARRIFYEK